MDHARPLPPAFSLMVGHLAAATLDVFAAYDFELLPRTVLDDAFEERGTVGMAVIGYAGRGVRGALVMMAAEPAVQAWMAAAGVPDGDVADTLGEFSNMLLGRLKERLLPLGISIIATTPTAVVGSGLRFSEAPGPSSWSTFDGPDWSLRLRLDATFDSNFKPIAESIPPAWCARAGEAIDFDALEASKI